eukprot:GHVT01082925.1.p3 GENE.GHVT01082925.1~~GHVT01082925.1.p3  ORF type:complete len:239 (+),score=27.50 GHVT01082925.1:112-828(+)
MATDMENVKLMYFGFRGKAEAIRLALLLTGTKFEEVRVDLSTFQDSELKKKAPFGQVPLLSFVDAKTKEEQLLSQEMAILLRVGEAGGLVPRVGTLDFVRVVEVCRIVNDVWSMVSVPAHTIPVDDPKREKTIKEISDVKMPKALSLLETILTQYSNESKCVIGDKLSIADLEVYSLFRQLNGGVLGFLRDIAGCLNNTEKTYPTFHKIINNVQQHQALQEYFTKDHKYIEDVAPSST